MRGSASVGIGRLSVRAIAVFSLLLFLTTNAYGRDENSARDLIDTDPSARRAAFSTDGLSGYFAYRNVYAAGADQDFAIRVRTSKPARLMCLGVHAFTFDLRDAAGKRYAAASNLAGGGTPIPLFVHRPREGRCPYAPVNDAVFPLPLDELYPNLPPGTYRLQVAFESRTDALPKSILGTIAFEVQ